MGKNAVFAVPTVPPSVPPVIHGLRVVQLVFYSGTANLPFSTDFFSKKVLFGTVGTALVQLAKN